MQKVKEKSNWKGETIVEIEVERLKAFRNHPFQVRDDDDLEKLKESIKMYGILTPLLVRLVLCQDLVQVKMRNFSSF